jgi:protein-S-isoprenylcysteine O-methyltransferase Ste14
VSPLKLILGVLSNVAVFAVLLFLPAGTRSWPRGWLFLGMILVGSVASTLAVLRANPAVLVERQKPPLQKGQPVADKILVIVLILTFVGVVVFIPLDVFRFQLMRKPGPVVSSLGLVLFVAGWWIITLALRANAFASPVVKHMAERKQTVVDTGVYGIVRHPLYAGAILFLVGMSLWLESSASALLSLLAGLVLAARIQVEERFLVEKLEGYEGYRKRVRHRLIPFIW